jgi:hypothetical protein
MNTPLFLVGLGLLVLGISLLLKNLKLSKNGIQMEAEIVEVLKKRESSTDSDGYTTQTDMYYPVFKYVYKNQEYRKESSFGVSNKRKYKVGNMLNIIFMDDKPDKAKVKSFGNMWIVPVLIIVVGVLLLIGSFLS